MFSKSCEYGIRSVIYIAANSNASNKIGIKPIAEKLEIPTHFLGKILQKLAKEGVIHSIKGPNGGFYTTEEDLLQPMGRVIEVLDGPKVFTSCAAGLSECSDLKPCPLHDDIKDFRNTMRDAINTKTIKMFADTLQSKGTYLIL